MPFRAPLPTAELRAIGERQSAADITALLWEIKRLRAVVLGANQVLQNVQPANTSISIVHQALLEQLAVEPVIMDEEGWRAKTTP